jgi:hypothetical protein
MTDFLVYGAARDSVFILTPQSVAAHEWADEHLPAATEFGGGVAVEHRYVVDILDGIVDDGLAVKWVII